MLPLDTSRRGAGVQEQGGGLSQSVEAKVRNAKVY